MDPRLRLAIAFCTLPLMAFSCVTMEGLRVTPPHYYDAARSGIYTIEFAVRDFVAISGEVESWALARRFNKTECSTSFIHTPLCSSFTRPTLQLTVSYSVRDNLTDVTLVGHDKETSLSELTASLRSHLAEAFGSFAIKRQSER